MMTDKDFLDYAIDKLDETLQFYTNAISQIEHVELRSVFLEIRSQTEKSIQELDRIAQKLSNGTHIHSNSAKNYISSQSNGILKHIDEQTKHALHAAPRS